MVTKLLLILVIFTIAVVLAYFDSPFGFIFYAIGFVLITTNADNCIKDPKAIDVYRGKTELKIEGEWKDSIFIPNDTIVIYKKSLHI